MLQPLDVGFFSPLTTAYRKHLEENSRLAKSYTMDKVDYIRLIQMARKNAATHTNITHAWQNSGLFPIQPQVVFDKWGLKAPEPRPGTPPITAFNGPDTPPAMTVTASNGDSISMSFTTPANVKEVNQLVQQIVAGNHDPVLPEKLGKACSSALANNTMLRITNTDLINVDQRKQDKIARKGTHWGEVRIMNLEVVEEREDKFSADQLAKELTKMCKLGPDLFEDTKRGRNRRKTTAGPSTSGPVPPTPGPLIPAWLDPPQVSPERQTSPQRPRRGHRGGARGGVRGSARGGVKGGARGGKKAMTKEVVVVEEEEVVVKYSRSGRPIKPKK